MPHTRASATKMAEADTTEAETELYSSDDEEFVIVFENLTVRDVRDGKRIVWSAATKTTVLKMAVRHRFSDKNLPRPDTLAALAATINVPTGLGKKVYAACLEKLVSLIGRLICEDNLYPGLIESATSKSAYESYWARFMQTDVANNNAFSITEMSRIWLHEHFHASTGQYLTPLASSGIKKTALIKHTVSAMIRNRSIRKNDEWLTGAPKATSVLSFPTPLMTDTLPGVSVRGGKQPQMTPSTTAMRAWLAWVKLRLCIIKQYQDAHSPIPAQLRQRLGLSSTLADECSGGFPFDHSEDYEKLVMKNQALFRQFFEKRGAKILEAIWAEDDE